MEHPLKRIVALQNEGKAVGIYSACTASPYVIEAVLEEARDTNSYCLIESTANQVNQYGGYTGMKAKDFMDMVLNIAKKVGLDESRIFLGGDHLGPLTWTNLVESEAMKEATTLIHDYVLAGFTKIHIDTSMRVADDSTTEMLSTEVIARRGAFLAKVAEDAYQELLKTKPDAVRPVYIVGSEVPIPGGSQSAVDEGVQVTKPSDLNNTVATFKKAFLDLGLTEAWDNVIAVVVQPGLEEKDSGCTEYDRSKAVELIAEIRKYPNLVLEGHSSDYQTKEKLRELVEDRVGVLKVGPGLTFALREGIFSLSYMEDILIKDQTKHSHFREVLEEAMLANPSNWQKHYHGTDEEKAFKRQFSFSDRSRYYFPQESVSNALNKLISNLKEVGIPLALLSQFMPMCYTKVRANLLKNDPEVLIKERVKDTIREYTYASRQDLI